MVVAAGSVGMSGCATPIIVKRLRDKNQRKRWGRGGSKPISFTSHQKRISKSDADQTVQSKADLIAAVQKPDSVVWIPGNSTIDMTGSTRNPIASGVTIASNRNLGTAKDGKGGTIKTTKYDRRLFVVPEGSCRVTGIRLIGPQKAYIDPPYENLYDYAASGIHFEGKSAIVDNCELAGWTSYAIGLGTTGPTPSERNQTQGWIHHNHCHHCQMNGLGYFVESYDGMMLIEWNDFSFYRHAIAGYGFATNGYEARFNRVGPGGGSPHTWTFDMHNLGEQDNFNSGNMTGGKYLNIHYNVFEIPDSMAMSLSGIPTQYARFANNWCSEKSIDGEEGADLRIKNNQFGGDAVTKGRKWLTKKASKLPLSDGTPSLAPWTPPTNQAQGTTTNGSSNNASTNPSKRMAFTTEVP